MTQARTVSTHQSNTKVETGEFAMRLSWLLVAGWLSCVFAEVAPGETNGAPSAFLRAGVSRRSGVDPRSPLESRVKETHTALLKRSEEIGPTAPPPRRLKTCLPPPSA